MSRTCWMIFEQASRRSGSDLEGAIASVMEGVLDLCFITYNDSVQCRIDAPLYASWRKTVEDCGYKASIRLQRRLGDDSRLFWV